ncbi:MAG: hypothetical protein KAR12_11640 [Methylococcales bacterium]|nr:hypothetical protein [Methylococcales bacterium]
MKRIAKNFAVILLCLVCLGCTSHSARLLIGSRHNPTNPDAVAVDEGMPIQPYEVIGKVHSHCRWNWFFSWAACGENTMMENLRQEAAYLGADALINVDHTSFSQFEWTDVHYHATAIRK